MESVAHWVRSLTHPMGQL